MRYDNIEIGTSDFDALIESAEGNGISVEPVKEYLDNLPDRDGWIKENLAISDTTGSIEVYYVAPDKAEGLPRWVRGCNSVGSPHPTIMKQWPEIIECSIVECVRMADLLERHGVTDVGFLKVDAEGHDGTIVGSYLNAALPLPDKMQFEWNSLSDDKQMFDLCNRLRGHYKTVQKRKHNVICW